MRILVGTLYCGEHEFAACCDSIQQQSHVDWSHFIVENLPNKLAHETLYRKFMEAAGEYDLFIKIDADMVLERVSLFEEVVVWMQARPEIDNLQIAVHDFFVDELIAGLHVFRSNVRWSQSEEHVFVDDWPVPAEKRHTDFAVLAPAALHCPDPSPFHAFHFGLHKGVKVMSALQAERGRAPAAGYHLRNIENAWNNFQLRKDRRHGLAALAGELALQGVFQSRHVSYNDPEALQRFQRYSEASPEELLQLVRELRSQNSRLAGASRKRILKFGLPTWKSKFGGKVYDFYQRLLAKSIPST